MNRRDALEMMREVMAALKETNYPPSLRSYWAGRVDGLEWAIKVLESRDGNVS